MNIEFASDLLCQRLLLRIDPSAQGSVVEVGLGSGNFSFEWAAPKGHRCIAVEPLPTQALIAAVQAHGVELIEAAMGSSAVEVPIYHGQLNGHDLPDISSLNPRWWGVSERCSMVPGLTLSDLCISKKIDLISLLKVDTEGTESDILSLLPALPRGKLPRLIVVEYGGGGKFGLGTGGWSPEFLQGTRKLLETLKSLDYQACVILEEARTFPIWKRGEAAFDINQLFSDDFIVGNLLFIHQSQDAVEFNSVLRSAIWGLLKSECGWQFRQNTYGIKNWLNRLKIRLIGN